MRKQCGKNAKLKIEKLKPDEKRKVNKNWIKSETISLRLMQGEADIGLR